MKKEESGVMWNETAERSDYFGSYLIFCDPDRRLRRLVGICLTVSENFRDKSVLSDAAKAFLCTGLCRFDRRVDRRNFCFLIQKEASIFQAEDRFCNDPDPAAVR